MDIKTTAHVLQYWVNLSDLSGHRLHVRLHIPQPDPVAQVVFLPRWIPGSYLIRDFSRHIETFQAFDDKGQNLHQHITRPDNHAWCLHNCKGPIDIHIVVYAWDLSVRGAHVDTHHAFFNGTSVFLAVEGQTDHPCEVVITTPVNHPDTRTWQVFTSMPTSKGVAAAQTGKKSKKSKRLYDGLHTHHITRLGTFAVPNYDALIDYPFEVGTPEVATFKACGALHQLVFTGHAPGLDLKRITRDIQKICETHITFFEPVSSRAPWLDSAKCYTFLITVTGDGYGGLEHRASTALITSRDSLPRLSCPTKPNKAYDDFLGLVSHEYFHTWHVKRIKPQAFIPYTLDKPNLTQLLWVFEGFTSYYDDLMLQRSQILSNEQYFQRVADTLSQVMAQSGRFKQSVAQSSFDAWTKYYKQDENAPNAIVSYYAKGSLIALCLDLTIRHRTHNQHSLDDVMREMWRQLGRDFFDASKPQRGLQEEGLHPNAFNNASHSNMTPLPGTLSDFILKSTGVDLSQSIQAWAYGTADLPIAECLGFAGMTLTNQARDDHPSLDATVKVSGGALVLAQVLENGAAHRAGLSAHDALIAVDQIKVGTTVESFKQMLARYQAGDTITVTVFRGDVLHHVDVTLTPASIQKFTLQGALTPEPARPARNVAS